MYRIGLVVCLFCSLAATEDLRHEGRDYVPDKKTAERIADAVLVAQFGEEQIKAQSPLLVDGSNKQFWIVQVSPAQNTSAVKGGGPAVWIDKHSGCLKVMEHMK
jgi:hypothetical protein